MHNLLAQVPKPLGTIGSGTGFGPFGAGPSSTNPVGVITRVISVVIGIMTIAVGIFFIFQLLTGAINWLTASGDKSKLEHAQLRITQATIGLIMVVATYAIVSIIEKVLGINILNPSAIVGSLRLGGTP